MSKFFKTPSLKKKIAARTSAKRFVRHNLCLKKQGRQNSELNEDDAKVILCVIVIVVFAVGLLSLLII